MAYDVVVRGDIVTPGQVVAAGWVAVAGEKIAAIGSGEPPRAERVHDTDNALVLPGLIDGQTHAGSRFGFPGLEPTTRSAVAGGITTLVDMPYDEPQPVDSLEVFEHKVAAIHKHAYGDVALYATVAPVPVLSEVDKLVKAGACAFKISSFENHPARFPRITNEHALDLLEALAATDIPVGLHNEDQEIVKSRLARIAAGGRIEPHHHDLSRPAVAEDVATANFLELGAATGAHVHIVHITTPRGFDLVSRYRAEGFRATAEMCVHYLHFDAAMDMPRLGSLLKVNPPIRPGVREALWRKLSEGKVEFVSSDHGSWTLDRKRTSSILTAAAGIPGLETLVPAFYSGLEQRGFDAAAQVALYLAERPARFFGLWPRKGCLAPGADADITVLTRDERVFHASEAHDDLGWSPFDGERLRGRVQATYVRGRMVWDGQMITGSPGFGRYIPRPRLCARR